MTYLYTGSAFIHTIAQHIMYIIIYSFIIQIRNSYQTRYARMPCMAVVGIGAIRMVSISIHQLMYSIRDNRKSVQVISPHKTRL